MLQHEIRRLRKAKGWNQENLAHALHITQHALSQYETGKRTVTLEMFEEILKALDVQIKFQIGDDGMKSKVVSSLFFEKWDSMEKRFPDWHVFHSGGGVWILEKDFLMKNGEQVLVSVADTGAILHKRLKRSENSSENSMEDIEVGSGYVSFAEYQKERGFYQDFEDISYEVLFQIEKSGWVYTPIAMVLFDNDTLEELENHANILKLL